jgi:hypothetical protein
MCIYRSYDLICDQLRTIIRREHRYAGIVDWWKAEFQLNVKDVEKE